MVIAIIEEYLNNKILRAKMTRKMLRKNNLQNGNKKKNNSARIDTPINVATGVMTGVTSIDALDKKILSSLNQNVRESLTQIAKKARSSKEVVHYRLNRLMAQGIIKEFVTIFGFGYWAYKVALQLQNVDSDEERSIIEYLVSHNNTNFVSPCSGNWDIVLAIMAKDPAQFEKVLREIMVHIGQYVHDYKVAVSIGGHTFGHTYILQSIKESLIVPKNTSVVFDEKDKAIANILLKNARAKLVELSTKTKIPVDTVKYRLHKMEENSLIKRYRLILDSSKIGYTRYEVFLRCMNLTASMAQRFVYYAEQHPNIEYLGRYVGSFDFTMTVHFKSTQEFRTFVLDVKKTFGKVITSFESVTLFETLKYTYVPKELQEK